jgi:hypothetical protein
MEWKLQLQSTRGRNHTSPSLRRDQQGVVKQIAKPGELSRESRLADVQSFGGFSDVRFFDEGVE